jgi:hypothetical protein
MKPKLSFSYLSSRKSIVRSSGSKKRYSDGHFLPQTLPRDYFSALELGLAPLLLSRKITLGNIFGKKTAGQKNVSFLPLVRNNYY